LILVVTSGILPEPVTEPTFDVQTTACVNSMVLR